jgi:hypothetical protein
MAYMSQELKKKLAPGIKAVLKKYGMKGTIAVRHHSSLVVNVKEGVLDFEEQNNVNPYWVNEHWEGAKRDFLTELLAAMKPADVWYDRSDAMTDYFDTAYYVDVNIGQWDKPYTVVA